MKPFFRTAAIVGMFALTAAACSSASACTGITVRTKDGAIIFGRTLEFAVDFDSNLIVVPRGTEYVGSTPGDKPGLRWKSKYAVAGMNAFNLPMFGDGLNERGLHVGVFYFPGYAKYQAVTDSDLPRTLAPQEFAGYLLGTCATADEAVEAAMNVKVAEVIFAQFGFVPPFHYVVNDASGKSVVLEHVDGELKIHRNPLGVMTNSPSFDWHMTNLGNYVNETVSNVPQIDVGGEAIKSLGQGSGMLGLPGDFTPPSRFVRAVAFSQSALPVETAQEGVLQAFHILNQFDIPKGAARGREHGKIVADYTLWTTAADLQNVRYYFRTFQNSRIRMLDLKALDFNAKDIKTISIQGDEQIEDLTSQVR